MQIKWYNLCMKVLSGHDIAEFIKERQARQVRTLRQAYGVVPTLAIVVTVDNPVIDVYMRVKQQYGADIQANVVIHRVAMEDAASTIQRLNTDLQIHGIIVQLPLEDVARTDEIVQLLAPEKDVDGLGSAPRFEPATPMAILWLLAAYGIDLNKGQKVLLIGRGRLVGAPLERILRDSGVDVQVADRDTDNLRDVCLESDVIITATGSPAILYPDMIKEGAVVVDAGVASEGGKTVGDLAPTVYARSDLALTPRRGGVGPLTVSALFENLVRAAELSQPTH